MKVELVDYHAGRAGRASSPRPLLVKGENAYGYAKTGERRAPAVRISPYDSNARRHTSFSSVWVYPVIDDNIDVEINESELRHRHLPRQRRWRAAYQHDRQRGAHHPPAERNRRPVPEPAFAA
jgi:hypothetical protein